MVVHITNPFATIQMIKLIKDKLVAHLCPRTLIIRVGAKIQEITIVIYLVLLQIVPTPIKKILS